MPYQLTEFQYQTYFPSQDIKQDVLLNSCLGIDDVTYFKINFNYLLEQWIIGGRDRGEVFKFDYPENEKSFWDETRP